MGDFRNIVEKLYQDYQTTMSKNNEDGYVRMSQIFDAVSDSLREYLQERGAEDMKAITQKLKGNPPLTAAEMDSLKMWIVGDAEYYVNTENNVEDWKKELQRLMGEISRYNNDRPSVQDVFKLQALLKDADRVTDDLLFYAAQQERVNKFYAASQNLTREDRDLLFGLLNTKLESKYY